ncbi:ABC transporter ATP-binding protein [Pilimelia columellifera]|uniref:ABC transporter ATP-binding protein n=1 Tax=Pilimelia columellifera subsp. columellifera TaxID=706583 RepID=A0ABN3NM31_9ACTN
MPSTARTLLRSVVDGQRRHVAASAVLAAGHQIGEALVPVLIGLIIDRAVARDLGWSGLAVGLTALAAVFATLSFSFRHSLRTGERAAFLGAHQLRLRVADRVLSPRGGVRRHTGALVNIATDDAQLLGDVNLAIPRAVAAAVGLVAGGGALLLVSAPLGTIILVATPLLLWAAHRLGLPLERRSHAGQETAARAAGLATDLVAGIRVLKGIGAEAAAARRYRDVSQASARAAVRAAAARSWQDGGMLILTGLLLALIAGVGGVLAADAAITVGDLVAAVGLAQFLVWPLSQFSWINGQLAQGRAAAGRLAELLNTPVAITGEQAAANPPRGRLQIDALRHRSLDGLTLAVGPGEIVAVVAGADDAQALVECLDRTATPTAGAITLDGTPLAALSPEAARSTLLVAAHDGDLFAGDLRSNLDAADNADPAQVTTAAERVGLRDLPDGLDTVVTEQGRSLSGGQRQRAALARALVADPPLLVLHDPTTAVDAVTEADIAAALAAARQDRATLLVTTSPALLAVAGRVHQLRDGRVVAVGEHADLVADADYRAATLT